MIITTVAGISYIVDLVAQTITPAIGGDAIKFAAYHLASDGAMHFFDIHGSRILALEDIAIISLEDRRTQRHAGN